jgi:hemerythrin superfamily protein
MLTRQQHEKILAELDSNSYKSRVENMTTSHKDLRDQLKELQKLVSEKDLKSLKQKWEFHKSEAIKHSKIEDKIIFVDIKTYYEDRIPNNGKGMKFIDEDHGELNQLITKIDETLQGEDIEKIKSMIDEYCKQQEEHMHEEEVLLIPIFLNFSFYEYSCYAAGIGYKFATGAAK